MFDYHMHSRVSYDSEVDPAQMAMAAREAGMQEICFTDHLDYELKKPREVLAFDVEDYNAAYNDLHIPGITIRNGVEIGMTPWNVDIVQRDLSMRHYDFVIGSVHHVDDLDPYFPEYWEGKTVAQGELAILEETLKCVKLHDNYDVLGHLTYISKTRCNPAPRIIPLSDYRDLVTEIMKALIAKGKGMEINTSGVDRIGDFLPGREYLQLFKDLGGQIVTTGSDAHTLDRPGQHIAAATELLKDIFGYVCTFQDRKPVFHKL